MKRDSIWPVYNEKNSDSNQENALLQENILFCAIFQFRY